MKFLFQQIGSIDAAGKYTPNQQARTLELSDVLRVEEHPEFRTMILMTEGETLVTDPNPAFVETWVKWRFE